MYKRQFLYFSHAGDISGANVWTAVDGFSGATPLAVLADGGKLTEMSGKVVAADKTVLIDGLSTNVSWMDAFIGNMHGSMGETSALACLIGAVILIAAGIGSWRIMAGVMIGMFGFGWLLNLAAGSVDIAMFSVAPHWHLVLGGFAFGTVFMATDPVSAAMTNSGKWIYGGMVGVMTILVRSVNPAFPEGIMLAILFSNVFAPLIDYFVVQANIKRRLAYNAT